uniref:Uncharacterized protein n=1 Tax=Meloidogyne javanica TaxID=6303 RepID=A0A915MKT6_MELJA
MNEDEIVEGVNVIIEQAEATVESSRPPQPYTRLETRLLALSNLINEAKNARNPGNASPQQQVPKITNPRLPANYRIPKKIPEKPPRKKKIVKRKRKLREHPLQKVIKKTTTIEEKERNIKRFVNLWRIEEEIDQHWSIQAPIAIMDNREVDYGLFSPCIGDMHSECKAPTVFNRNAYRRDPAFRQYVPDILLTLMHCLAADWFSRQRFPRREIKEAVQGQLLREGNTPMITALTLWQYIKEAPLRAFPNETLKEVLRVRQNTCKVFRSLIFRQPFGPLRLQLPPQTPDGELNNWLNSLKGALDNILTRQRFKYGKSEVSTYLINAPIILVADSSLPSLDAWEEKPIHQMIFFGPLVEQLIIIIWPNEEKLKSIEDSLLYWKKKEVSIRVTLVLNEPELPSERKEAIQQCRNLVESFDIGFYSYDGKLDKLKEVQERMALTDCLPEIEHDEEEESEEDMPLVGYVKAKKKKEEKLLKIKELIVRREHQKQWASHQESRHRQQPNTSRRLSMSSSSSIVLLLVCLLFFATTILASWECTDCEPFHPATAEKRGAMARPIGGLRLSNTEESFERLDDLIRTGNINEGRKPVLCQTKGKLIWISKSKEQALSFSAQPPKEMACNGRPIRVSEQGFGIDEKEYAQMISIRTAREVDEEQVAAGLTAAELALRKLQDAVLKERCQEETFRHFSPTIQARKAFNKSNWSLDGLMRIPWKSMPVAS